MVFKSILPMALVALAPALALAEGDPVKGEKVFKKCKACHAVGADAKNKVGPMLNGIVGAPVGAVEGFKYSDVFVTMSEDGKTWTVEELDGYLTKPRDYAKGTKMSFAGLRKEDERADVIAYLATFNADGSTEGGS